MLHTWTRKGEAVKEPLALPTATRVALGNSHGAALTAGGELFTFGGNEFGELGRPEVLDSALPGPVSFPTMSRVVSVACGFFHTAAVTDDGMVWTFGWGRWGQLGQPAEAEVYSARPVRVDQLAPRHAVSVACGHHSTIALDSQGEVLAWGFWRGAPPAALEDGQPTPSQSTVERLPLPGPACAVHAGGAHAVAVLAGGTLWVWGSNSHGQLGAPRRPRRTWERSWESPTPTCPNPTFARRIAAGVGDRVDRYVPACAQTLHSVRSAGCGEEHTAAIGGGEGSASGSGAIWTWGRCEYGRGHGHHHTPQLLRVPSAERTPLLIACGFHHCACVFSSGEILSWSAHALGGQPTLQLHAPPAGSAFTQLACGGSSTAAIAVIRERPGDGAGVVHAGFQPPLAHDTKRLTTPPSCARSPPQHRSRTTPPSRNSAPGTSYAGLRATDAHKGSPPTEQAKMVGGSNSAHIRFAQPALSTPPPTGRTASLSPALRTPPHPLNPSLSSRHTIIQPPLDAWREVNIQSTAHGLHEVVPAQSHAQNIHGELQDQLQVRTCPDALGLSPHICADGARCQRRQREADRRADAEDRVTGERRRAERVEDAATAADARAREAVLKVAATRRAMADAEAEQGKAPQLLQALQASRAEAARLRVQLQQAKRVAAQQPAAPVGRHAGSGGAGGAGGAGTKATRQGAMPSQARLRSERQACELAQLTKQMRHRALLHAVRLFLHLPARGRFSAGRAFERWRATSPHTPGRPQPAPAARPRAARVALRTSGTGRSRRERELSTESSPPQAHAEHGPQLRDELHRTRASQRGHQTSACRCRSPHQAMPHHHEGRPSPNLNATRTRPGQPHQGPATVTGTKLGTSAALRCRRR